MKFNLLTISSIFILFTLTGCATIKKIDLWPFNNKSQAAEAEAALAAESGVAPTADTTAVQTPQPTTGVFSNYDPQEKTNPNQIVIRYKNKSSDVTLVMDPTVNDVEIQIEGEQPEFESNKSEEIYWGNTDELTGSESSKKIVENLRQAQEAFYQKDFTSSMRYVNNSLAIAPTAEAYALKGSIYYMTGKIGNAKVFWERTLEMNPQISGISEMLAKLESQGF